MKYDFSTKVHECHTPGEWWVCGDEVAVGETKDFIVAYVNPSGPLAFSNANRNLIAAAPNLLEACRAAREIIHSMNVHPDDRDPTLNYCLHVLDNAIYKALGKDRGGAYDAADKTHTGSTQDSAG